MQEFDASFLPASLREPERFESFFERQIKPDAVGAGFEVHEATATALGLLREKICREEGGHREVFQPFRFEEETLTKSASSARTKLQRERKSGEPFADKSVVEDALRAFNDLARFRVVFTLLADVERALTEFLSGRCVGARYLDRFEVVSFKDFVFDRKTMPGRGHRARQFTVRVVFDGRPIKVEVQFMTLLQHAWDRRNHPLYEHSRVGGALPPSVELVDFAMSETLYLLDRHADDAWNEFLEHQRRASAGTGDGDV